MRWLGLALAACALACDAPPSAADAGDGGDAAACTGATFECCTACDDDTPGRSVCVNGQMQCPGSSVPASSLNCPCYAVACSLPPARPACVSCDGGAAQSACNAEAGQFECPPGSHDVNDLDAACSD